MTIHTKFQRLHPIATVSLVLILQLALTACTSIAVNVPSGRMVSSESLPLLKTRIGTGGATQASVEVESDASSRPFTYDQPKYENMPELGFVRGALGVGQGFEILAKGGTYQGSSGVWGKYQFFGPRVTEGAAEDTSLAATVGFVGASDFGAGDQNGIGGPGGFDWNARANSWGTDFALIWGYRIDDRFLIFGGPFYTAWKYNIKIHHDRSDDGTSPEADYTLNGEGERKGVSLAMEFSTQARVRFVLIPELVVSHLTWTNLEPRTTLDLGVTTAIQF
ncbi:MAG TPA: hypothetical protein VFV50_06720 [Bdellovibrionales bacterium]|nr:hypothetical protein [Bdellovibrionales bacterium]